MKLTLIDIVLERFGLVRGKVAVHYVKEARKNAIEKMYRSDKERIEELEKLLSETMGEGK